MAPAKPNTYGSRMVGQLGFGSRLRPPEAAGAAVRHMAPAGAAGVLACGLGALVAVTLAVFGAFRIDPLPWIATWLVAAAIGYILAITAWRAARRDSERTRDALARAASAEADRNVRAEQIEALAERLQSQSLEVEQFRAELVQASRLGAVGELAAAVAHEVNNPLTGVLGFAELLLSEIPAEDPRHEEVEVIHAEAIRARGIIRALVDFARPRQPQRMPTEINALARTTVETLRDQVDCTRVRVTEEYGELPQLDVDPDAIRQVLLNLFKNAVQAMPEGGELRVSTSLLGDKVALIVADSGIGMDESTRSRVFVPFFTTSSVRNGGGLGLSVSLQLVESHGGSIDVQSEPGRGSRFTVWLPVAGPATNAADPDRAQGVRIPARPARVLEPRATAKRSESGAAA